MIPATFDYFQPHTLDEAVSLLTNHEDAKVLAGGHSLIPAMKLRLAQPKSVIDISRVADLSYVREQDGRIVIGALATHYEIESSALLRDKCPLLSEVREGWRIAALHHFCWQRNYSTHASENEFQAILRDFRLAGTGPPVVCKSLCNNHFRLLAELSRRLRKTDKLADANQTP